MTHTPILTYPTIRTLSRPKETLRNCLRISSSHHQPPYCPSTRTTMMRTSITKRRAIKTIQTPTTTNTTTKITTATTKIGTMS